MYDSVRARRRARDAGLAAVNRWTRRAVAGGVMLAGVLGAGLAHLLPGQAAVVRHDSSAPAESTRPATPGTGTPDTGDRGATAPPATRASHLTPPREPPRPARTHPHATSGGS